MTDDAHTERASGHRPQQQQEPVHAPYRDAQAPQRKATTVVWVTVAIAAVLILGIALIVAAINAA